MANLGFLFSRPNCDLNRSKTLINIAHSLLRLSGVGALSLGLLLSGCGNDKEAVSSKAKEGYKELDDLYIVDCLLPNQVRRLGNTSYLPPRKAIKTTTSDCRIRGGEYVDYNRADYRSALNVWLPQAQAGDAEAQNYVGEIFEKGLGQTPDFASAVSWYKKAADQGFARAQINLGYMYEKGQGVPRDMTIALNYYRQASGIKNDTLVLNSDAQKEIAANKQQLADALQKAQTQANVLQKQVAGLQTKLTKQEALAAKNPQAAQELASVRQELEAMKSLYEKAQGEKTSISGELQSVELAYRKFSDQPLLTNETLPTGSARTFKDINFGRYYALIIGNQDYSFLEPLRSPISDARKLKEVLEAKYGFSTLLIENGSEKQILNTINNFYSQIGESDNLLIFYAGHGQLSTGENSKKERGYWLPIDAKANTLSTWINNAVISDHLDRLKARSILVIADSCYAGFLGSEKSPLLFGVSSSQITEAGIKASLNRRARLVISSGGLAPVLDGTSSNHSVFANALIETLEHNNETLRDSNLFSALSVNVRKRANAADLVQMPEMKPVREAGHAGGTFYFVPKI
ncbi:MAG: caspase family protein [Marinagarivorans sp.]